MAWNPWINRRWTPWEELHRIQSDMSRLLQGSASDVDAPEQPPIDLWSGPDGLVLLALVPGLDAGDIDVSVAGDTVTLKGGRDEEAAADGETYHRRERRTGKFVRTFQLPFQIESDAVQARLANGVLEVALPRSEAERPRKIAIAK